MSASQIKISAIIPAFNCEKTLERTVYSLIQQTFPPFEIIIVNNNSTDKTSLIIESLINQYPDLIIGSFEEKPGANNARNNGLELAQGNWIQMLDGDDELEPDKINDQINIIKITPETDVVYSIAKYFVFNKITGKYEYFKKSEVTPDPIRGLIQSKLGRTSTNLWKKETLEKVNFFDHEHSSSQEYFLMLKLFKTNAHFSIDYNSATRMYIQGESVSQSNHPEKTIEILTNKLIFGKQLRELLASKNIINQNYSALLKKRATQEFYSVYLRFKSQKEKLIQLKKDFKIEFPLNHILKIYIYHVHNTYNFKIPIINYLTLPFLILRHLSKLKVK